MESSENTQLPIRGRRIGRYEIRGRLACDALGSVFLATQGRRSSGAQRAFATRIVHPHVTAQPQLLVRLLEDFQRARKVESPHVARVVEVGEHLGLAYAIEEYVDGLSLSELLSLQHGNLPLDIGVGIAIDMLRGLTTIHRRFGAEEGSMHGGLDPYHVVIGFDGRTRLVGLGTGRVASKLAVARPGVVARDLPYAAPEQLAALESGPRADLFSVAAMCWQMITGYSLFAGRTRHETAYNVMQRPIPALHQVHADAPRPLDAWCQRGLQRDPSLRFDSAEQMHDALVEIAKELGLRASARDVAGWMKSVATDVRRRRRAAIASPLKPEDETFSSVLNLRASEHRWAPPRLPAGLTDPALSNTAMRLPRKPAFLASKWPRIAMGAAAAFLLLLGAGGLLRNGHAEDAEPAAATPSTHDVVEASPSSASMFAGGHVALDRSPAPLPQTPPTEPTPQPSDEPPKVVTPEPTAVAPAKVRRPRRAPVRRAGATDSDDASILEVVEANPYQPTSTDTVAD